MPSFLRLRIIACLVAPSLAWMITTGPSSAQVFFDDGSRLDLVTVHGATATASANLQGPPSYPPASILLQRTFDGLRFDNHSRDCWWMLEFPRNYSVSRVRLVFYDVKTIGLQIKTATDEPPDWSAVAPAASFNGPTVHNVISDPHLGVVTAEFPAVPARFIRIEIKGQNGGENGMPTAAGNVLLFLAAQAWGPNRPAITPEISAAQSAWARGSCTVHDATMDTKGSDGKIVRGMDQDASQAINDGDFSDDGPMHPFAYWVPGSPAQPIDQTAQATSFYVTLKNRMKLSGVAYSTVAGDRTERPRDMKIYTSMVDQGDTDWVLQKTLTDISRGEYVEISFDQPASAKRVRFEIGRIWSPNIDPSNKLARGIMAQFFVYGDALPPDFQYQVDGSNQVGIQVFDRQGVPVRTLQLPDTVAPGTYGAVWDGLDNLGAKMPPGDYECRVVLNPAIYSTPGPIGNTSTTMGTQDPLVPGKENPSEIDSVVVDHAGNPYTADNWDEAGQDFRKWDRATGQYVLDDAAAIRNGDPNGLPYAIALDDKYIYCSTFGFPDHPAHVRRFTIADARPAPFPPGPDISKGHILLYPSADKAVPPGTPPDEADLMKTPLKALAVAGGKLFVADYLANKVWIFDAGSGAPAGSFAVKAPIAMTADPSGRLWVGHEKGKVTVFSADGKQSADVITDAKNIAALAFGPDNLLYLADGAAEKILIYKADPAAAAVTLQRTFGQPAAPGDQAPDHFYQLRSVAVDSQGYLSVAQNLWVVGCRLTRFAPDGKVVWDQVGGEFCSNGNYAQERPDDIISQTFHHYRVDKKTGKFQFLGCVISSDPVYPHGQASPMRLLKLNGQEFAFMGYGNGEQVYRKDGEAYRLCSMWGSSDPNPDGVQINALPAGVTRPPYGLYSWHDTNGNGKIDPGEITWQIKPGGPLNGFGTMGVNADDHGNSLFASLEGDIKEVPMTGFDQLGNPVYDLSKTRIIVPRDPSPAPLLSDPRKVIRADDGSIYVDYQSRVYPKPPEANAGWMTGWLLARYDKDGKRLWYTRLPETCTGMDYVPGGGVMLITVKLEARGTPIYHYSADGTLIGIAYPSQKVLGFSANTDTTAALSVSRDPRDGILDMFSEDCVGNRFRWQRADDHQKARIIHVWVHLTAPGQPLQVVAAP